MKYMDYDDAIKMLEDIYPYPPDRHIPTLRIAMAIKMAQEALDKCNKIEKIINSHDADFIANYVRSLFL